MTQTPISKAIDLLNTSIKSATENKTLHNNIIAKFVIQHEIDSLQSCITKLQTLLPYEREVIEGVFHDGNHNEDFDSQSD